MAQRINNILVCYRNLYALLNPAKQRLTLAVTDWNKGYGYILPGSPVDFISTMPNRLEVAVETGEVRAFGSFEASYPRCLPAYLNEVARTYERQVGAAEISPHRSRRLRSLVHNGLLLACPSFPLALSLNEREQIIRHAVSQSVSPLPIPK